jgi:hypothetical protein
VAVVKRNAHHSFMTISLCGDNVPDYKKFLDYCNELKKYSIKKQHLIKQKIMEI